MLLGTLNEVAVVSAAVLPILLLFFSSFDINHLGIVWLVLFLFFGFAVWLHLLLHVCYCCCCASVVCLFCLLLLLLVLLNGVKPHKTVARKHFNYVLHTFCSSASPSISFLYSFFCCCFLDYNFLLKEINVVRI